MSGRQYRGKGTEGLYVRFGKRILDTLMAAISLVIASPLLLVCAIAIYTDSRRPIFYRQWRVGLHGKPFQIVKLRTMISGADTKGPRLTASGDPRITKVGRFLRRAKLDEVPQLLNVIRGEMSLVGPRPELPEYVAKYETQDRKILDVKPGVTGPASVWYVDEEKVLAAAGDREEFYISRVMRDKLRLDLAYCHKISLREDLKIMFQTAASLFGILARAKRVGLYRHFQQKEPAREAESLTSRAEASDRGFELDRLKADRRAEHLGPPHKPRSAFPRG